MTSTCLDDWQRAREILQVRATWPNLARLLVLAADELGQDLAATVTLGMAIHVTALAAELQTALRHGDDRAAARICRALGKSRQQGRALVAECVANEQRGVTDSQREALVAELTKHEPMAAQAITAAKAGAR